MAAPKVPLLLDYSHYIFQGYSQDEVDPLLAHAGHLHLRQARRGELQTIGRLGEIDFDRIYSGLSSVGFDGFACIEHVNFPWHDCDRVDCITETAAIADGFRLWSARQGGGTM
jgi:sugar phosphate isomerase/epimerase